MPYFVNVRHPPIEFVSVPIFAIPFSVQSSFIYAFYIKLPSCSIRNIGLPEMLLVLLSNGTHMT